MPRPAWMLPEVGTLYPLSDDVIPSEMPPTWTQPGGPGTTVYPQQMDSAAGEFEPPLVPTAMYIPGCGHPCNCLKVFRQWDIITQKHWAIITCPACGFIQLLQPYAEYENYIETPIVVT